MTDTIRQVDYYYVEIPDKPGAGLQILSDLRQEGVNLLACCGFPTGDGKSQIDLIPDRSEQFQRAAAKHDLKLSDRKRVFLIQGEDRVGAVADIFSKLTSQKINITGAQAVCAGAGRWAMVLWVKPADFQKASKALEV